MNLIKKRPFISVCVCCGGGGVLDKVVNLFYLPFYI